MSAFWALRLFDVPATTQRTHSKLCTGRSTARKADKFLVALGPGGYAPIILYGATYAMFEVRARQRHGG
jgi:hypothetical protein